MKYKNTDIDGLVAAIKSSRKNQERKHPVKQMMPAGIYVAALSAGIHHRQSAGFDGLEMAFAAAVDESSRQVANWTGRFGFDSKGRPVCQLFPMDGQLVVTKYSVQVQIGIG